MVMNCLKWWPGSVISEALYLNDFDYPLKLPTSAGRNPISFINLKCD